MAGSPTAGDPTFHTAVTVERVGDEIEIALSYSVPRSITWIELRSQAFDDSSVEVVETTGLERTAATTYEWEGGPDPELVLRVPVRAPPLDGQEYAAGTDGWALVTVPTPSARFSYRGEAPARTSSASVVGDGYATSAVAYLGDVDRVSNTSGPGTATIVAPANTVATDRLRAVADLYAAARADFSVGLPVAETVAFVLPTSKLAWGPGGFILRQTVVLRPQALGSETVENVPAHEYVHTRLGVFGGSSNWLREGSAQYYGALISLNDGVGTFAEFRTAMQAPEYRDQRAVLADRSTWKGSNADYDKGAHVLAALDAEIRIRSEGSKTLRDVFAVRFDDQYDRFHTYEGFRQAVIDVSGDSDIGTWLDRYVTTEAVPEIPNDPALYVTDPESDTDGDSLSDGRETDLGTDPFAADSDGDGLDDTAELDGGTDPTVADSDADGLNDGREREAGTDPNKSDSDGDGAADGADAFPLDDSRLTPSPTPSPTAAQEKADPTVTAADSGAGQAENDAQVHQPGVNLDSVLMSYLQPSGPMLLVIGFSLSLLLAFVIRALI